LPAWSIVTSPSNTFCQVTWPIATGAAIVGSRPVGSTLMPRLSVVFAASAGVIAVITRPAESAAPSESRRAKRAEGANESLIIMFPYLAARR
jgi:hypothetical protein